MSTRGPGVPPGSRLGRRVRRHRGLQGGHRPQSLPSASLRGGRRQETSKPPRELHDGETVRGAPVRRSENQRRPKTLVNPPAAREVRERERETRRRPSPSLSRGSQPSSPPLYRLRRHLLLMGLYWAVLFRPVR